MREKEEERGATRCESESVSMFYSCRAFPVSGNNGGHGSPLPALLGLSRSLLKIERDKERAVSGEISLSLSLSRVQPRKIPLLRFHPVTAGCNSRDEGDFAGSCGSLMRFRGAAEDPSSPAAYRDRHLELEPIESPFGSGSVPRAAQTFGL